MGDYMRTLPAAKVGAYNLLSYPEMLPMDNVHCTADIKPKHTLFQFHYIAGLGARRLPIKMVMQHASFEIRNFEKGGEVQKENEPPKYGNVVCLLQLDAELLNAQNGPGYPYAAFEAKGFCNVLRRLQAKLLLAAQALYPDYEFELTKLLSSKGNMSIPVDMFRKDKLKDLIESYSTLEETNRLPCFRVAYGYMIPMHEEDPTGNRYKLGIKILAETPQPVDAFLPGTETTSTLLVSKRKRSSVSSRAALATLKAPRTSAKPKALVVESVRELDAVQRNTLAEAYNQTREDEAALQQHLLRTGCGTQVLTYIYPFHKFNPHIFCQTQVLPETQPEDDVVDQA